MNHGNRSADDAVYLALFRAVYWSLYDVADIVVLDTLTCDVDRLVDRAMHEAVRQSLAEGWATG